MRDTMNSSNNIAHVQVFFATTTATDTGAKYNNIKYVPYLKNLGSSPPISPNKNKKDSKQNIKIRDCLS